MTQLDIFSVHKSERTKQGTAFVQNPENRKLLKANCIKLMKYWQRNNIPISKYEALQWLGVDCLAQRAADIQSSDITPKIVLKIQKREGERFTRYSILCTCHHVGGELHQSGCWVHDEKLKIK